MPIRISGLVSGLDTESLVSELVSAYSVKKDNYVKAQTKLSWKQDAWKSLNKKVYSLYSSMSSLRFSSAYSLKKTTVSDSTKATVTAASNAVNGTQKLVVKELAATGYLTGGTLKAADGSNTKATGNTKLSELKGNGYGLDEGDSGTINVNGKEITLSSSDTISSVVNKLKDSGLNASFDEKNQRIFVSSKNSGTENEFTLTASNEGGAKALQSLGLMTAATAGSSANKEYQDIVSKWTRSATDSTISKSKIKAGIENGTLGVSDYGDATYQKAVKTYQYATMSDEDLETLRQGYNNSEKVNAQRDNAATYQSLKKQQEDGADLSKTFFLDGKQVSYEETTVGEGDDATTTYKINGEEYNKNDDGTFTKVGDESGEKITLTDGNAVLADVSNKLSEAGYLGADGLNEAYETDVKAADEFSSKYGSDLSIIDTVLQSSDRAGLASQSLDTATNAFAYKVQAAKNALSGTGLYTPTSDAKRVDATDAQIELNGAAFTASTNSFSINGLTIDVTGKTDDNGITITTSTDTQGIYDKIKDFLSQYNDLMNEMTSLYNAASAKGYEPLTSDEKSAMSDTQVEEWEAKIKSALLRRDSTLDGLISTMTNSMQKSYVMGKNANGNNITFTLNKDGSYAGNDGKTYQLNSRSNGKYTFLADDGSQVNAASYSWSSFGIATLGLLNSAENEYNAYHIDGDEDDDLTSGKTNKLMAAIAEDPDSVIDFLKNATGALYDSVGKKMSSTTLRSAYTVYNDKEMNKEYSDYTDTIKKWEDKVTKMEDSYYKKFAAMESALATLQGQSSSLGSLF